MGECQTGNVPIGTRCNGHHTEWINQYLNKGLKKNLEKLINVAIEIDAVFFCRCVKNLFFCKVIHFSGDFIGDGITWPVVEGCNQYTLTVSST